MTTSARRVAALATLCLLAASCAHGPGHAALPADPDYDALARQPTPASWRAGALWTFVEVGANGAIVNSRTLRITDTPADSVLADGEWKAVESLPLPEPGMVMIGQPVYQANGRNLVVELANMHHNSVAYVGELGEHGFVGRVRRSEYTYILVKKPGWHPSWGGAVYGVPVAD